MVAVVGRYSRSVRAREGIPLESERRIERVAAFSPDLLPGIDWTAACTDTTRRLRKCEDLKAEAGNRWKGVGSQWSVAGRKQEGSPMTPCPSRNLSAVIEGLGIGPTGEPATGGWRLGPSRLAPPPCLCAAP